MPVLTRRPALAFMTLRETWSLICHRITWVEYPISSEMGVNAPYFENGQATILFANNAGSVFEAVIDKTGAFVGEPEKVDVSVY